MGVLHRFNTAHVALKYSTPGVQVTPSTAHNDDKRDSGRNINFFLRRPGQPLANEGSSSSFASEGDWTGGVTDETSLGPSVSGTMCLKHGNCKETCYNTTI